MSKPLQLSIIAAIQQKDRGIGFKNQLLTPISEDLQNFKKLTIGHPIIMGRKTFESIGKALPNRHNIVVSKNHLDAEGIIVVSSPEEALERALELDPEVFIIGGATIYEQLLPKTGRIYLTQIKSDKEADTFFPDYSEFRRVVSEGEWREDEKTGLEYRFVTLTR